MSARPLASMSATSSDDATAVDLPPPRKGISFQLPIKGKSLRANTPHTLPKRTYRRIPTSFAKIVAAEYRGSGTEADPCASSLNRRCALLMRRGQTLSNG
jgi:hypothetical protein